MIIRQMTRKTKKRKIVILMMKRKKRKMKSDPKNNLKQRKPIKIKDN